MTTPTNLLTRLVTAIAAAAVLTALAASPVSADPPPAAAGNTSHGFLVDRGVVTTIDHPKATTIPATPDGAGGNGDHRHQRPRRDPRRLRRPPRPGRPCTSSATGRAATRTIDDPPSGSAYEYVDINNRGEIVGFYNDAQGATTTGFLRSKKGRFTSIDVPGSQVTGPLKINDRRQVVGIYVDARNGTGCTASCGTTATSRPSTSRAPPRPWSSASTTAGRWSAPTSTPQAATTASSATSRAPSPPSPPLPAPTQWREERSRPASTTAARSSVLRTTPGWFTRVPVGAGRSHDDRCDARRRVHPRRDINNRGQIVGDYATRPPPPCRRALLERCLGRLAERLRPPRVRWWPRLIRSGAAAKGAQQVSSPKVASMSSPPIPNVRRRGITALAAVAATIGLAGSATASAAPRATESIRLGPAASPRSELPGFILRAGPLHHVRGC